MRIFLLTLTALVAFAANSVLNRAALIGQGSDPVAFMSLRLISGATMLLLILLIQRRDLITMRAASWQSAIALLTYAMAFSFAYLTLDAGLGALILFGGVQVTMFAGGLLGGERPGLWRWIGSGLGLAGLAVLFLPGAATPPSGSVALMLIAGVGWGIYSLRGQGTDQPLAATAGNFLLTVPFVAVAWIATGSGLTWAGAGFAIASGAIASGIGYAIWYTVLPTLGASLAAIAQLTVPLIALGGGMVFLGEIPDTAFYLACALVLGGVALAVLAPQR